MELLSPDAVMIAEVTKGPMNAEVLPTCSHVSLTTLEIVVKWGIPLRREQRTRTCAVIIRDARDVSEQSLTSAGVGTLR
jgi:hypothetical protein